MRPPPHCPPRHSRNLGTFGGSIAYGDPAAEWPAHAGAERLCAGAKPVSGTRRIPVDEFSQASTPRLAANEVIESQEIPLPAEGDARPALQLQRAGARRRLRGKAGLAASATLRTHAIAAIRLAWIGIAARPCVHC
jgi:carbon-monoxide dehydrogenase medium subunit